MPFELHAVIIDKKIPLEKAKQIAQDIIKDKSKSFYRVTDQSYRFRNIPKTKFKPSSFRSKVVNDNITLIFGEMK
jgi:ABC-type antimicrobial peptide transport system ATPase subunit